MMQWGDYGWGMEFGFGWIFMVLFGGLITAGIVYPVLAIAGRPKKTETEEAPLDMLKKRFAKGESRRKGLGG